MYLRIFHFNFLFKISKSGLNLAEDTVSEVENILEDVTQNETQNNIFNIQKTKIMASGPITSWQIEGETVIDFFFGRRGPPNHCRW